MRKHAASSLLPLLILIVAWGCSDDPAQVVDPGGDGPTFDTKSCLGCHSSEEGLKAALGPQSQPAIDVMAASDG